MAGQDVLVQPERTPMGASADTRPALLRSSWVREARPAGVVLPIVEAFHLRRRFLTLYSQECWWNALCHPQRRLGKPSESSRQSPQKPGRFKSVDDISFVFIGAQLIRISERMSRGQTKRRPKSPLCFPSIPC